MTNNAMTKKSQLQQIIKCIKAIAPENQKECKKPHRREKFKPKQGQS
jgi:hypothetical protein